MNVHKDNHRAHTISFYNHRTHKVTVFNILKDRKIKVISDNKSN